MQEDQSWIFFRGLVRDKEHWYDFVPHFKSVFTKAQVECIDLPGAGEFNKKTVPLDLKDWVDWVRAHSSLIKQNKRVYLLGMSLGGMLALKWAEMYPREVKGLVVINSSIAQLPITHRVQPRAWHYFLKILRTSNVAKKEELVLQLTSNLRLQDSKEKQSILNEWVPIAQERPVSALSAARQVLAASRFWLGAKSIHAPVLILVGAKDQLALPEGSRLIQLLTGGTKRVHPSAGHDITLDDKNWVTEEIKNFFFK